LTEYATWVKKWYTRNNNVHVIRSLVTKKPQDMSLVAGISFTPHKYCYFPHLTMSRPLQPSVLPYSVQMYFWEDSKYSDKLYSVWTCLLQTSNRQSWVFSFYFPPLLRHIVWMQTSPKISF